MSSAIYLRPLTPADAQVSHRWRNNPAIWLYTKFRPANTISLEIEEEWIKNSLHDPATFRFAICIRESGEYIGNVQLIHVRNRQAEFHLFIGEQRHWRKGYGQEASAEVLSYGFERLQLDRITLEVHNANAAAMAIYKKMGFEETKRAEGLFLEMSLRREDYYMLSNKTSSPASA